MLAHFTMDIAQFNEAIIPYCKALGLTGATVATVVTQTIAPISPTNSPSPTPSATTAAQISVTPTQTGFGGLLQQAVEIINPPLISSRVDDDLSQIVNGNLLSGNWKFMPGVTPDGTAFRIHKTDLALVEQDGSFAQSNPPINFAGTHLTKISGDFQINAKIDLQNESVAYITLYGEAPRIADEFRFDGKKLDMTIKKDSLRVNDKTFSFSSSSLIDLTITKKGTEFVLSVNGKDIGKISDTGIFAEGNVWFGFDSEDNDWLLTGLTAKSLLNSSFEITDGSVLSVINHNANGVQAKASAKRPSFVVGAAMALGPLTTDADYANVALDNNNFGGITPENDMKMINLQPRKGEFTFGKADALVSLAKQNGLTIHGHTLVFGEANPVWLSQLPSRTPQEKAVIEQIMKDHITTVVRHFGNDVPEWDVVNEPIADYDMFNADRGRTLRRHIWYKAMGAGYIATAFEAAHKANPTAMLFVNEYGLEFEGERWDAFLDLMKDLKHDLIVKNIPIEKVGVGFQSHVYEAGDKINPATLKAHIKILGALGFKTRISEMDVYNDDGDAVQAKQYADIFGACFSELNCIGWTTWMLSDKYDFFIDDDGSIQYGEDGLYDATMKTRPGLTSILKTLQ